VKRFKDQEKGLQNNEHLLGIEDASDDLYKKVSDYLKTTHEAVEIMKKDIESKQKKTLLEDESYTKKRNNEE